VQKLRKRIFFYDFILFLNWEEEQFAQL